MSTDFENCFAHEPAGVAETIELGIEAGLAGCSVEDWDGEAIYDVGLAVERVAAAAEAAHRRTPSTSSSPDSAKTRIHGRDDLADTISGYSAIKKLAPTCSSPLE